MARQIVDIEMQLHAQTDRAVKASSDGDEKSAVWLPLSQVDVQRTRRGFILVTMPVWLATEKGLV